MTTDLETIESIADEYPIYLRWGQLLDLHSRLGLGEKYIVKQHLEAGRIVRVRLYGRRCHYTRSSVVELACPKSG